MTVPAYLSYYVLGGSIGVLAALLFGLHRARERAGERNGAFYVVAAVLLAWFAIAVLLASLGVYRPAAGRPPTIQYGIVLPILIGGVLIWRWPTLSRLIDAVPQQWVVAIQAFRVLGVIFLVLYASRLMPAIFAWPAGVGDVLVGLFAPLIARAASDLQGSRSATILRWNLLGLADLSVALATGFLSSPSPVQLFAFDRPNELIAVFPLVLIPTFLVPLSVLLHAVSLAKLAGMRRPSEASLGRIGSGSPLAE